MRTLVIFGVLLAGCGDDSPGMDAGVMTMDSGTSDASSDVRDNPVLDVGIADSGTDAGADAATDAGGPDSADAPVVPPPKRLVVVYTPHGMIPERWTPSSTGRDFELSETLTPLSGFRDQITVISGLDLMPYDGEFSSPVHGYGPSTLLTGVTGSEMPSTGLSPWFGGGRSSLDSLVSNGETRFDVAFLSAGRPLGDVLSPQYISWTERDSAREPMSPDVAFARLFEGATSTAELEALELRALPYNRDAVPVIDVQFDIAAEALIRDVTRAVTIQTGISFLGEEFPSFGYTATWHELSHSAAFDPDAADAIVEIWAYHATQIAELASRLDGIAEGEGSMLDNTLIVWLSESGNTRTHGALDIPVVLIGNLDGAIDAGQHVAMGEGRYHTDLLLTLAQLFEPGLTSFGDARYETGPISEILR